MAIKQWRIKDGAPEHYVQGAGTKVAGDTFAFDADEPWTDWVEEVEAPSVEGDGDDQKPKRQGGRKKPASEEPDDGF